MKTIFVTFFIVLNITLIFCCTKESDIKDEPIKLRYNFSETEFKNALIGEWRSVFEIAGKENVMYLKFNSQGKAEITIEKDGISQKYSGDYTIGFLRAPEEENVTLAEITISSSGKEIVLPYVYFGEHNAFPINSGLFLRIGIDVPPYGVLERIN